MDSDWKDCITICFDLPGTKNLALTGHGSSIMRDLHRVVAQAMDNKRRFPSVCRAYTWNDSVLLLAYVGEDECAYERALHDAAELKLEIDAVGKQHKIRESYAVAVKGQALPPPENAPISPDGRFVFIEASSYAMANCLEIPKCFNKNRHLWYIDERIKDAIGKLGKPAYQQRITLLPKHDQRWVYAYDNLWADGTHQ